VFIVEIVCTTSVDLQSLLSILNGSSNEGAVVNGYAKWSEPLNIIDHILHQSAKKNFNVIKKSVFPRNLNAQQSVRLGGGVLIIRGIYVVFKAVSAGFNQAGVPIRSLGINVDTACVAFWEPKPLMQMICEVLKFQNPAQFAKVFADQVKNKTDAE
jgi:hypothetical protein